MSSQKIPIQSLTCYIISIVFLFLRISNAQSFSHQGCYSESDLENLSLDSQGSFTYQTPSYCQGLCSTFDFYALLNGESCYCGSSLSDLESLSEVSQSQCDVNCNGWPSDTCGGSSAMDVYTNDAATAASSSSSSSSSRTSTSSTTTSTSTSSSSSTRVSSSSISSVTSNTYISSYTSSSSTDHSSSIDSSSSSSSTIMTSIRYTTHIVTASVISASNQIPTTIFVTTTSLVQTVTPQSSLDSASTDNSNKSSSLSDGAIAGIVIGVLFGTLFLVLLIVFLFFYKRSNKNQESDLEETKQYQPYSFGDENATPIVIPPTSSSNWRIPSRTNTANTSSSFSNFSMTMKNNNGGEIIIESNPNSNATSMHNSTPKVKHPSTVFEEPVSYIETGGNQRFSTSSLPDMIEQRPLRIVNPDDNDMLSKQETTILEEFINNNNNNDNLNLNDSYVDLSRSSDEQSYDEKNT